MKVFIESPLEESDGVDDLGAGQGRLLFGGRLRRALEDHEGSGAVKVQLWDGKAWKAVTPNWVIGDRDMIQKMVAESSAKYAAEKKITPACLPG